MDVNVDQCEAVLTDMLIAGGFVFDKPNASLAVETFRKFCKVKFSDEDEGLCCKNDMVSFSTGITEHDHQEFYYWEIGREFSFYDENEKYIQMKKTQIDIYYLPNEVLLGLSEVNIWAGDGQPVDDFFEGMEDDDAFKIPLDNFMPISCSIFSGLI